jgi:pyruvate,water dikinase
MTELLIIPLGQVEEARLMGGKARALSQLIDAGFNVPPGFVITAAAPDQMSTELEAAILVEFDGLGAEFVAVRSSAVAEDGANDAWAGQMDTFLNIDRSHLLNAVKKCWDSANSARAKAYAKQKSLAAGKVAVVVQAMVQGDVSGVAFSVHPVTQNANHMIIEAVPGLAESLVSGKITPDSYVLDKRSGKIIESHGQAGKNLLDNRRITEVAKTVGHLEEYFHFPVDVEWTFSGKELFILQSRPITTLS